MAVIQLQLPTNAGNNSRVSVAETAVRLETGPQFFGVLSAPRVVRIRCLRGRVWITQEANRNDMVLDATKECRLAGSQRIFMNAWEGALLTISAQTPQAYGATTFRPRPMSLRLKITQGAYVLSGADV